LGIRECLDGTSHLKQQNRCDVSPPAITSSSCNISDAVSENNIVSPSFSNAKTKRNKKYKKWPLKSTIKEILCLRLSPDRRSTTHPAGWQTLKPIVNGQPIYGLIVLAIQVAPRRYILMRNLVERSKICESKLSKKHVKHFQVHEYVVVIKKVSNPQGLVRLEVYNTKIIRLI
jgi:hypothetical protein